MDRLSKNFKRNEFSCRCGCGFDTVDACLVQVLQVLRVHFGKPVHVNSACRCKNHNTDIGGSDGSQHLLGKAADVVVKGVGADVVADFLDGRFGSEIGLGRYNNFTHVDVRSNSGARWDYRANIGGVA